MSEEVGWIQTSVQDELWTPSSGGFPGMSKETLGGITCLIWFGENLGIPKEELEDVTEDKDIMASFLSLLS